VRRFDGRRNDERGVLLVIMSVALSVMLTFAALVFDLSQLRVDRRVSKSVADTAVRAGLGLLHLGPWSGVCRAREYLKTNSMFSDLEGEQWFQLNSPLSPLASSPCLNTAGIPFKNVCLPGELGIPRLDTWGKLTATAGGGRYSVEIQSGYPMPDPRFPEDVISAADTGDMLKGACDNLVVVIKHTRSPLFGGVVDPADKTTTIRSVGRISNVDTGDHNPALLLLERSGCSVLTTSGTQTRVVAQPYLDHPGVIQIDSADSEGGCTSNQALLRGATTASGPSIIACSASLLSPKPGCNVATANKPGRVGIHALNFPRPASDYVTTPYSEDRSVSTYGDVRAVPAAQSGRTLIDDPYRDRVVELDQNANSVINSNGTGGSRRPPGCSTVTDSRCTGTDGTWLVLTQTDCDSYATFFTALLDPLRPAMQRIWFDCNLTVSPSLLLPAGLKLSALNSFIVITGTLSVTSTFAITDPRKVYIGGSASGPAIGLDVGNGGNLNIGNPVAGVDCPTTPMVNYTKLVVGDGSLKMGSGAVAHLCGTFLLMANGYNKIPAQDGTVPCTTPCSTYKGAVDIGSGSTIDWSAPNLITIRRSNLFDRENTSPFEDVALWTEAGGAGSRITGGGTSRMSGVYFLGNADAFTLAGGGGTNVLSAQFITRRMVVTGNSTVNLVINPLNSLPLLVYELVLVR